MANDQISLDEYLTQLNQRIENTHTNLSESLNYSSSTLHPTYGAVPNVTVGSGITSSTFSPNSVWTSGGTTTAGTPVWQTSGTGYTIGTPTQPNLQVNQGGKIKIEGEKADIEINGKSMRVWMEQVEERLNILTPNPDMEKDWDDLRRLGERYRKLEKKCKEKSDMWNKLKAMPKPEIK